jgi:hypothetical protein
LIGNSNTLVAAVWESVTAGNVISAYSHVAVELVVVLDEMNTRQTVAAGEPTGRKRIFCT